MSKKRILMMTGCFLLIAVLLVLEITVWRDRRYLLLSVLMAAIACVPFYYAYEKKEGSTRRMVILAVMVVFAAAGRLLFAPIPGCKPVMAIVIITAVYLGAEAGFLTGSLAALISNLFFGQGPWTPFQMLAWGLPGYVAGLPFLKNRLKNRMFACLYGVAAGIFYSMFMDIWVVLSFEGEGTLARYQAVLISSLPSTFGYVVSNVIFLLLLMRPFGKKLERIGTKHGIF